MRDAAGSRWAIATPHVAATEAGAQAFRRGGNAVDAALAAAAVLTVVYPHMCGVGGDVMALVHDGEPVTVNGSGRAPRAARLDPAVGVPFRGPVPITVPGAVAAWQAMAERWGTRPLREAVEAALPWAADGVPVARSLAGAVAELAGQLGADRGWRAVYLPDGRPLRERERLVQPALAATLERIAENGARELYEGETAGRLVAGLRASGCPIDADDLRAHTTDLEPALTGRFRDLELATMGPNSQGFVLLAILAALERCGLEHPLTADAPALAAIARAAGDERDRELADPAHMRLTVQELLADERIAALATAARAPGRAQAPATGDTIALVTADGSGMAVSLIQSLYTGFGSGVLEPSTGVVLHNRGACFSADPASPNALAGGKRPLHTLMPLVASREGRPAAVLGTMGGRAQPLINAQVLLRMLAGASPGEAVAAPRFIVGDLAEGDPGDALFAEARATEALAAFAAAGLAPDVGEPLDESAGHAHAIAVEPDGLRAGSDPRADGAAAAG
jgi:gamma-glutamyltranspeptidase